MSVLGYGAADFSTTGPWDSGGPNWIFSTSSTGTVTSPILPCSQWQGVYAFLRVPSLHPVQPQFNWWRDAAATHIQGGRSFMYDGNVPNAFEANFRHLGQYLTVSLVPQTPSTVWTPFITLTMTNRTVGFPTMPDGVWISNPIGSIAPSGTATNLWTQNVTGRFAAITFGGTQGVNVSWQFLDYDYSYQEFNNYDVAANKRDYREMIGPNSSTQVVLTNLSAASACTGVNVRFILSGPPG